MIPIVVLVGPPAVGKSSLAESLLKRFRFGIHLPVDDLRERVVSGLANPIEWTDETTRQFNLAEHAACDLAIRYQEAGFAVVIDHCHNLDSLNAVIDERLHGRPHRKVVMTVSLEKNLERNRRRQHKPFSHEVLVPTIEGLHPFFQEQIARHPEWIHYTNEEDNIDVATDRLIQLLELDTNL